MVSPPKQAVIDAVTGNQRPLLKWVEKQGWLGEQEPEPELPASDQVQWVWDYWMKTFGSLHKRKPRLTEGKKRIIRARLKTWEPGSLYRVIDYVITDDWWMGKNDRSEAYYFVDNIFRNDDRVEKLLLKAGAADDENAATSVEATELKAQLATQRDKMLAGDYGYLAKRKYVEMVSRVVAITGERFDWEEHVFCGED